ncbi:MAG: uvrA 3 [Planctomycetota bacterium]|nr:uvrA 3 [Planctomycetota bacterium]
MSTPLRWAELRGGRAHNLRGVDLDVPLGRLVVVTGLSGSGKSSLAFDTLHAEGQRRYIETFSAYTRQFLERLDKPEADRIEGLPPSIAVGQNVARRSARSTVGTVTEVHDALGLLFARIGRVECRNCGAEVRPTDPEIVAQAVDALPDRSRYMIAFPMEISDESDPLALADGLREDGFTRVRADGVVSTIDSGPLPRPKDGVVEVIVDRLVRGSEAESRRLDSIETAFAKGFGRCRIITDEGARTYYRGWKCSNCGMDAVAPEPRLFRYNSPVGACPSCEGFGRVIDLDLAKIVPDPRRTVREGAIVPWTTPAYREWNDQLIAASGRLQVDVDRPFGELPADQVGRIVDGGPGFSGLRGFFRALEKKTYKMHVRVFLSRWRGYSPCPACGGKRLRPESLAVKVGGLDIAELSSQTISRARSFLDDQRNGEVAGRILSGVLARLDYLDQIGLGYLTLDRQARTLSGGEARRVALTAALGSGLVNTMYVLDEPSIGLHPRDVVRLVDAMKRLRDAGNSLVVVEHEESVMRAADHLVEVGPGAGDAGGRIVYAGPVAGIEAVVDSPTATFLSGRMRDTTPTSRRATDRGWIELRGASGHNLKEIDVAIPLGVICVVSGVSGSGKSTLVEETVYPALARAVRQEPLPSEPYRELAGFETLADVVLIDQSPIGRSARSNPVTYLKAFDEIRKTFAQQHEAKVRNYGPSRFSFNVEGGRCDRCEGNGELTVDMQFLADVRIRCPECRGTRFRPETLEVTYRGKTIAEVLDLTAREAFAFFRHKPKVLSRLRPLLDVGLDYLRLGQPATTLSGGEAQRLKLAASLASTPGAITRAASKGKTLYIFDEPTTGLHPVDVEKLLQCFHSLADQGHSALIVEHNPQVMLAADWIIDLGPDAGDNGGRIVAQGSPEDVARAGTFTGAVLAEEFAKRAPSRP